MLDKAYRLWIFEIFRSIEIREQVKWKEIILHKIHLCFLFRFESYFLINPRPTPFLQTYYLTHLPRDVIRSLSSLYRRCNCIGNLFLMQPHPPSLKIIKSHFMLFYEYYFHICLSGLDTCSIERKVLCFIFRFVGVRHIVETEMHIIVSVSLGWWLIYLSLGGKADPHGS